MGNACFGKSEESQPLLENQKVEEQIHNIMDDIGPKENAVGTPTALGVKSLLSPSAEFIKGNPLLSLQLESKKLTTVLSNMMGSRPKYKTDAARKKILDLSRNVISSFDDITFGKMDEKTFALYTAFLELVGEYELFLLSEELKN